ncbi:hypothetical protein F503_05476 [Ophiostoma piceae UAMH 11346]|uniref:Clr5 domain-containing protein n=1 Tax=Ophiostoma piceae (strain UAMH 11346) TaxID=1262450 RepID=S3CE83_OPHP1|nr:hypothetical protein F503_05476 [Ophiostoma piceae UAMH 11346]
MTKTWLPMREIILDYYQTQGFALNKVMDIMTQKHSFTASQRAYRQQFQKWGVFKYNRKSRVNPESSHQRFSQARSSTPARYSSGHRYGCMPYDKAYGPRAPEYAPSQLSLQLPLPKLESTSQYSMAHHMPYSAAHMAQSSRSSSGSTDSSPYESYRPLSTKQAYHVSTADHDAHHGLDSYESLNSRSPYPPLQASPQPQHSVYSHSYYSQAASAGSSPSAISTQSMDRYQSCNPGCCSHEQSSMDQGSHPDPVPLSQSDSRSSYAHTSPFSHHSSISASPPSSHGGHDSHIPQSPNASHGSLTSHTAALSHHSHAHLPTMYPQVYTQAIGVA